MPPYDEAVPIARALVDAAPERVLWGTDFPHPNATHEADEADLVDLVPHFEPDTWRSALAGGQSGKAIWFRRTIEDEKKGRIYDEKAGFQVGDRRATLLALPAADAVCACAAGAGGMSRQTGQDRSAVRAGGVADVTARIVADKLGEKLGQRFVIENMPGAGGITAANAVLAAPPDGYTLGLVTNGTAISVAAFKTCRSIRSRTSRWSRPSAHSISFSRSTPIRRTRRSRTSSRRQGAAGQAQHRHHQCRRHAKSRRRAVQVDGRHRTSRSSRSAIRRISWSALLRDDVQMLVDFPAAVQGQVDDGKLRLLATSGPKRSPLDAGPADRRWSRRAGL